MAFDFENKGSAQNNNDHRSISSGGFGNYPTSRNDTPVSSGTGFSDAPSDLPTSSSDGFIGRTRRPLSDKGNGSGVGTRRPPKTMRTPTPINVPWKFIMYAVLIVAAFVLLYTFRDVIEEMIAQVIAWVICIVVIVIIVRLVFRKR